MAPSERSRQSHGSGQSLADRLDLEWIATGRKAGLSLLEINEFRVSDLAAYIDIVYPDEDGGETPTQGDIDRFLG